MQTTARRKQIGKSPPRLTPQFSRAFIEDFEELPVDLQVATLRMLAVHIEMIRGGGFNMEKAYQRAERYYGTEAQRAEHRAQSAADKQRIRDDRRRERVRGRHERELQGLRARHAREERELEGGVS